MKSTSKEEKEVIRNKIIESRKRLNCADILTKDQLDELLERQILLSHYMLNMTLNSQKAGIAKYMLHTASVIQGSFLVNANPNSVSIAEKIIFGREEVMHKPFKIDTHIHTKESSPCGHIHAADLVKRYHALGFDAIIITDHLFSLGRGIDWDLQVTQFLRGYKAAREEGKKIGLHVLLGAEIRFDFARGDYLIYGFDESFLRSNPLIFRNTPHEFFAKFGDELLIVQAHPYRSYGLGWDEDIFLDCVHGIEVFNANPRHSNYNHKAAKLHKATPHLYAFAGSDAHVHGDEGLAYMLFDEPILDSHAFCASVKANKHKHPSIIRQ